MSGERPKGLAVETPLGARLGWEIGGWGTGDMAGIVARMSRRPGPVQADEMRLQLSPQGPRARSHGKMNCGLGHPSESGNQSKSIGLVKAIIEYNVCTLNFETCLSTQPPLRPSDDDDDDERVDDTKTTTTTA